jgi:hypothetical protein
MRHPREGRDYDLRDETFGEEDVYVEALDETPGERSYVRELKAMSPGWRRSSRSRTRRVCASRTSCSRS